MNSGSPAPREPSADIRQAASALHQTFVALTMEGFDERQALIIIGQILASNRPDSGGARP